MLCPRCGRQVDGRYRPCGRVIRRDRHEDRAAPGGFTSVPVHCLRARGHEPMKEGWRDVSACSTWCETCVSSGVLEIDLGRIQDIMARLPGHGVRPEHPMPLPTIQDGVVTRKWSCDLNGRPIVHCKNEACQAQKKCLRIAGKDRARR